MNARSMFAPHRMGRFAACFALVLALVAAARGASADETALPQGTVNQDAASSGSTDLTGGDKFQTAAPKPDDKATKDATELQLLGGGLLATGNARTLAATASGQFRLRRDANQFSAAAAVNYGRAPSNPDDPSSGTKVSVENYQGKARYDRFLGAELAAFLSATARRDRFQGLDLRLNVDPGVAYYFLDTANHQFWGELGYDLQFDVRRQDALDVAAAQGTPLDKTATRHSGRVFAGYANAINEAVAFKAGVEYIQSVTEAKSYRVNGDASLTSKIGGKFSLATTFSLKYDNNPLPKVRPTDTTTSVSLVYQLL
jgi:putative salt-induced outer membrane protein